MLANCGTPVSPFSLPMSSPKRTLAGYIWWIYCMHSIWVPFGVTFCPFSFSHSVFDNTSHPFLIWKHPYHIYYCISLLRLEWASSLNTPLLRVIAIMVAIHQQFCKNLMHFVKPNVFSLEGKRVVPSQRVTVWCQARAGAQSASSVWLSDATVCVKKWVVFGYSLHSLVWCLF